MHNYKYIFSLKKQNVVTRGMVAYTFNPSLIEEAEANKSL